VKSQAKNMAAERINNKLHYFLEGLCLDLKFTIFDLVMFGGIFVKFALFCRNQNYQPNDRQLCWEEHSKIGWIL